MDNSTMLGIWLGVVIFTLIVEIMTQGLTTIWFSIGAAVAAVSIIWNAPIWLQIAIFCVLSVVIMLLARPFAKRMMQSNITPTNIDRLISEKAVVIKEINNKKESGQVSVRDLEWLARSADDSVIEKGETVTILRIEGVKLIVEKLTEA
ncbi:MAG: NfeD family protein [Eubacterium sp.]|nr:NfeD family protein [Eubacterium sp.]